MVGPLVADVLYGIVAALFGLSVAVLVLASGRPTLLRSVIGLVLLLNVAETANGVGMRLGLLPNHLDWIGGDLFDPILVLSLALILAVVPGPAGGKRGRRAAVGIWAFAIATWLVIVFVVRAEQDARTALKLYYHAAPFLAAGVLLQVHVVPAWLKLPPGPLRGQTLLVGAGIGIGLMRVGVLQLEAFLPKINPNSMTPDTAVLLALGVVVAGAALRLAVAGWRERKRDALVFASVIALGGVLQGLEFWLATGVAGFPSQVVRPLLLSAAVLRYDLFSVSRPLRRALVPVAAVSFAVLAFLALSLVLAPQTRAQPALDPIASVFALAGLVLAAVALRRPLAQALRAAGGEATQLERLEQYRLALERAHAEPADPARAAELADLRADLRITDEEHDTLSLIVAHHIVLPTSAVRGPAPGYRVAGRYEVLRPLGEGGFGRAVLARDGPEGPLVVVKQVLRPWEEGALARRASLEREAEVGRRVASPHVARTLALVEDGPALALVREYVAGRTLEEEVRAAGPLTSARAAAVMRDVLAGLAALHREGLLHLDLKPQNVVLAEDGRAVLIDQGTARPATRPGAATATAATASAPPTGTLAWMAPEQVRGGPLDERADVFAAGALFYYVLTGRPHVQTQGRSAFEIQQEIVEGGPPAVPRNVPRALALAVRKALARSPEKRFAGVEQFASAIRRQAHR